MQETTVTNMPTAALWIIAIAQIVFALATMLIAFAMMWALRSFVVLLEELTEVAKEAKANMPRIMSSFGKNL